MIRNNHDINRRTALRSAVGAAFASVAGCLNEDSDEMETQGESSPSDPRSVFERVAVEETSVVVEFQPSSDLDAFNLIQPNGEIFVEKDVVPGSEQIEIEIGTAYPPGEFEIVALRGGEIVAKSTLLVEPDLSIKDLGIGRNQPEKMWTQTKDEIREEAFVTVENQGGGPDLVTKLLFIGGVPYPSDEEGTNYANDEDASGIFDPESNSEVDHVVISSGEQTTIYSSRSPFAFVPGAGVSCTEEQQSETFEVILERPGDRVPISTEYNIQYTGSEDWNNCELSIDRS